LRFVLRKMVQPSAIGQQHGVNAFVHSRVFKIRRIRPMAALITVRFQPNSITFGQTACNSKRPNWRRGCLIASEDIWSRRYRTSTHNCGVGSVAMVPQSNLSSRN
ncbi:MAG: hypothetical protein ACK58L_18135, partial [Planctomycetota bacterium]